MSTIERFGEKPDVLLRAESRAERLAASFVTQGMHTTEELIREVETAQLASRFDRNATVEDMRKRNHAGEILSHLTKNIIEKEGEAGYKRAQLTSDFSQIQQELLRLAARLKVVALDLEMSKLDG